MSRRAATQFLVNLKQQVLTEFETFFIPELYETSETCRPEGPRITQECTNVCNSSFDCFSFTDEHSYGQTNDLLHTPITNNFNITNKCAEVKCDDGFHSFICYCDEGWDKEMSAQVAIQHRAKGRVKTSLISNGAFYVLSHDTGHPKAQPPFPIVECTFENCERNGLHCHASVEYINARCKDMQCPLGHVCAIPNPCPQNLKRECVNIDECTSNPCKHGKCEDAAFSYKCVCDRGWTGINCEIETG